MGHYKKKDTIEENEQKKELMVKMNNYIFRIGILNCKNGKIKIEKNVSQGEALKVAGKVSMWFDKQDTFFNGNPVWEYWENSGILSKFEALISGDSWDEVATESIAVFNGNKGTEHEFFIERKKQKC